MQIKNLKERLLKARELEGDGGRLAAKMGVSHSTIQKCIKGDEPKHQRTISAIKTFLRKKGL